MPGLMNGRRLGAIVLVLAGAVLLVAGVMYLTIEARSLPSVLGAIHRAHYRRTHRGLAALIVGAALIGGGALLMRSRRRRRLYR